MKSFHTEWKSLEFFVLSYLLAAGRLIGISASAAEELNVNADITYACSPCLLIFACASSSPPISFSIKWNHRRINRHQANCKSLCACAGLIWELRRSSGLRLLLWGPQPATRAHSPLSLSLSLLLSPLSKLLFARPAGRRRRSEAGDELGARSLCALGPTHYNQRPGRRQCQRQPARQQRTSGGGGLTVEGAQRAACERT